ncbi:hypothetical protein BGZ73_001954 [Actinomortierella ambigua]|nr:hypothetical protein BGZ73_001954 [Actinomortierella ambigua]
MNMLASAKKKTQRQVSIVVDTDRQGPDGSPLIVSKAGMRTFVRATVIFENTEDSRGSECLVRFKGVVAPSTQAHDDAGEILDVLEQGEMAAIMPFLAERDKIVTQQWKMDLVHIKKNRIAKGTYSKTIEIELDPTWPSSHQSETGVVQYVFIAKVTKILDPIVWDPLDFTVKQPIWVFQPSPDSPLHSSMLSHILGASNIYWSLKTNTVRFGELFPMQFRFIGYSFGTPLYGQPIAVEKVVVALLERHNAKDDEWTLEKRKDIQMMSMTVKQDWPCQVEGWERTVHIPIPEAGKGPKGFSSTVRTRLFRVSHMLTVKLFFRIGNHPAAPVQTFESNGKMMK